MSRALLDIGGKTVQADAVRAVMPNAFADATVTHPDGTEVPAKVEVWFDHPAPPLFGSRPYDDVVKDWKLAVTEVWRIPFVAHP